MPKSSLSKNSSGTIEPIASWEGLGNSYLFHTHCSESKDISATGV